MIETGSQGVRPDREKTTFRLAMSSSGDTLKTTPVPRSTWVESWRGGLGVAVGWGVGACTTLALGGALGTIAVLIRQEILLAVVGGIFVIETMSVIIQVASFKLTGKRVFKMAPIHHHFEQLGWPEQKIVVRFWIVSIILGLVALSSLKLR